MKGVEEELRELQGRWLATHDAETLAALYSASLPLCKIIARWKAAMIKGDRDYDRIGHDMASALVAAYLNRPGFRVRAFRKWLSLAYNDIENPRTKRRRAHREAGEVPENFEDDRVCIEALPEDSRHYIAELCEHPKGAYLVHALLVKRSLRAALAEGEEAGVSRAWIRDHAVQVVTVWRTLHYGKRP